MHRRAYLCVLAAVTLSAAPVHAGFDEHLFVVSTDFTSSGSASTMALTAPFGTTIDVESVGADPVVRTFGDRVYVVNRFGNDAIQVIDPGTLDTVLEFSVGPLSNPQDIAVVDEYRAYISRFGSRWLYLVNPTTGAVLDSLDLGGFADADGRPEMAYMALSGDRLFVQLQRLDTDGFFDPVPPSYLAVVDVDSNTLIDVDPVAGGVQAIELMGTNPHQKMQLDEEAGLLYVSEIGAFGSLDGGIEVVDVVALESLGVILTETTVGGDVSSLAVVSPTKGYVLTSSDFFATTTVTIFNPTTGAVTGTLASTPSFTSGLVIDEPSGMLYLADREITAPGIRVFDTASDTQVSGGAISVGLPPADMVVVRPVAVDVAEASPTPPNEAYAAPNPFSRVTELSLPIDVPDDFTARMDLFDALGRRVRTLDASSSSSVLRATWDGRDGTGRAAAPGIYIYRVRGGATNAEVTGRVVLVR